MRPVSRGIDRIEVTFDEPNLVANAGLLLVATLVARLGLESLINSTVCLSGRVGGALPGRKVLTLVHALVAGGSPSRMPTCAIRLDGKGPRSPGNGAVDARNVPTFVYLRPHPPARQGASRSASPGLVFGRGSWIHELVIDVDSTICEVCGSAKEGAGYGYTKKLCYHPVLATRATTGEVLHARMRKGKANTQRGAVRFIEELVSRVRRAGASGQLLMRFDSGFWSNATIETLECLDVGYTMGVKMVKAVKEAVSSIEESSWRSIEYTCDGEAQVAECDYRGRRLIVRRTRLVGRQAQLWPDWRHFGFVTDLGGDAVEVDAFHRNHATVELAIRDLKEGSGLSHVPSGHWSANCAWLLCAVLAHDLIRWSAILGEMTPAGQLVVARTVRTCLVSVPGRLVSRSGRLTLRAPIDWPWSGVFERAIALLRALPPIPI